MAPLHTVNNVPFTAMYTKANNNNTLLWSKVNSCNCSSISASCQLIADKILILMSVTENCNCWATTLTRHYPLLNISSKMMWQISAVMCCCGWGFLSHRIPTCRYCPWLAGCLLLLQKPRSSPLGHGQPTARSRWTRSRGDGRVAGVGGAAAFWIATKDNLSYYSKLKSVVVSLRTPGCKLLWLVVSEAAESPSHPPSSWSVSPASKALGLTCLLPASAGPQPALGLPRSSGERWCLLGPSTLH